MFERFTEKAAKVVILAQEESRRLEHNYVGTEQILLGLIREDTGIASSVLTSMGANLERARLEVEGLIGRGARDTAVEIPFTARAKALLEMTAEIALKLGHSYIGTDHLLLGIVREGERIVAVMGREPSQSLAFQVLQTLGIDPLRIRDRVTQSQAFGAEIQEERFSLQPSNKRLKTLLPPMSDQALKVWHVMGSQMSWEGTDTTLNLFWVKWLTRLSDCEIQSALNELIDLGVIERIKFA